MRRVACFVASSRLQADERPAAALDALADVVAAWLKEKGLPVWQEGTHKLSLKGGREAIASIQRIAVGDDGEWEITFDEPLDTRRFFSRVCLGVRAGMLHLFLEMRAGAEGYHVAPIGFDIRTPRVLRDLLERREWYVGRTLASTRPVRWHGADAGANFLAVIRHEDRNLPIVVVSQLQGAALTPTLANELARDLVGLAIVADLDEQASWSITREAGKEWSCFGGAIRIYWPIRLRQMLAREHPLWTRDRLLETAGTEAEAARRIRDQLRRWLHELSTYAVDEPQVLFALRSDANRARIQALRDEAATQNDYQKLAEELQDRCTYLESELERTREQSEELRAQNVSLLQVWNYQQTSGMADIAPVEEAPVTSVEEAVQRAQEAFSGELVFGDDVAESVLSLAADAGPPDKILTHLSHLAEMTRKRRDGGLGKDVILWLRERGVNCSSESQTTLNSTAEMGRRTWSDGRSQRKFEKHLKPSDGTSPDRCVRIYFDYDDVTKMTVVGYVGRHF
jgi:hypothetical protein